MLKIQIVVLYCLFFIAGLQCLTAAARLPSSSFHTKKALKTHHNSHHVILSSNKLEPTKDMTSLILLRGGAVSINPNTWSLSSTKAILQIALVAFNILCWSLPLRNTAFQHNARLLSVANSFAGGIFLMISFGHLIPHVLQESSAVTGYSILYYVVAGFLAMLFVEKVAFGHDDHDEATSSIATVSEVQPASCNQPLCRICNKWKQTLFPAQPTTTTPIHSVVIEPVVSSITATKRPWRKVNSGQILCLAMGIHSLFESAALGISDSKTTAVLMSASIALHQPAESLALVVAFLKHCNTSDTGTGGNKMSKRSIVMWLLVYSCIAFVGSFAGNVIRQFASEEMESIVVALTAGTFVYVGASEIVNEEFNAKDFATKFVNFVTYVCGMLAMVGITNIVDRWESLINAP